MGGPHHTKSAILCTRTLGHLCYPLTIPAGGMLYTASVVIRTMKCLGLYKLFAQMVCCLLHGWSAGTIIHSDEWAAYQCVASLPNVSGYDTVIRLSLSITGTHTQNVESYWNRSKMCFKVMKGCLADMLPSYLEFLWREPRAKLQAKLSPV